MISEEELKEEQEMMESVERGEWVPKENQEYHIARAMRAAENTVRKDQRMNIRMTRQDMMRLKARALEEGIPYQTLVTMILHKYVTGRLVEKN